MRAGCAPEMRFSAPLAPILVRRRIWHRSMSRETSIATDTGRRGLTRGQGGLKLPSELPWYEFAPTDRERLSALVQLGPRVVANLQAGSNLPQVAEAVRLLADYAFQMLPEVASRFDVEGHNGYVRAIVDRIVQAVSALPPGAMLETSPPSQHQKPSLRDLLARLALVRALAYFGVSLVPLTAIVELSRIILKISDDTVVLAVVSAAAVIAVGLQTRGHETPLDKDGGPQSGASPTPPR